MNEREPRVLDMQMIDRERAGIEAQSAGRERGAAVRSKSNGELRTGDAGLRGAQLPAHQRAEREFDAERLRAQSILAARADLDAVEKQRRRRQDANIDRAADPHGEPDKAARLRLETRPVRVPVDKIRPDQRRHQRQDHRNRKAK